MTQTPSPKTSGSSGEARPNAVAGQMSVDAWRWFALASGGLAVLLGAVVLWRLAQTQPVSTDLEVRRLIGATAAAATEGDAARVDVVRIERAAQMALVLVPARRPQGNEFRLTGFDDNQERALGVDSLRQSSQGDFPILFRTRMVRAGTYRLLLEERTRDPQTGAAGDWSTIGEYRIALAGG